MSILQMSIQAGVLIIAIVVIRAIALNKLPKNTFLVLWGVALVRLLIPFSLSSQFSFYTIMGNVFERTPVSITPTPGTAPLLNTPADGGALGVDIPAQAIGQHPFSIDPVTLVWIIGMVVAFVFFAAVYWRNCRELRFAWIIRENRFVDEWVSGHKLLRPLTVMQSDRVTTPITVGYLRPRIILPKKMDITDEQLLRYVLTHEYYHIRRFDAVWKLLTILALCVHWFNPLVWVMVILLNRDLEITCDEMVVRHFGASTKTAYAYSLISMFEQRNKLAPLFSGFSKNAAEERITAIMKIKKTSFVGIILAFVLVAGATTVFATNASGKEIPAPMSISDAITKTDDELGITLYSLDKGQTWLTLEQLERVFNEQDSDKPTSVLSYLNEETGATMYVNIDIPQINLNNNFRPVEHAFIESVVLHPGDIISYDISTDPESHVFLGLTSDRATFLSPEQEWINIMGGIGKASGTYTVENEDHYMYVFVVHSPADDESRYPEIEVTYLRGTVTVQRTSEN